MFLPLSMSCIVWRNKYKKREGGKKIPWQTQISWILSNAEQVNSFFLSSLVWNVRSEFKAKSRAAGYNKLVQTEGEFMLRRLEANHGHKHLCCSNTFQRRRVLSFKTFKMMLFPNAEKGLKQPPKNLSLFLLFCFSN